MNILMLAPEPFFQPRGTPISVYFRIKALSDLGHKVDLVTYHLGQDRKIQNLRILRIPALFFIKNIKIGPSWTKIPLDFLLLFKTFFLLTRKSYDLIFSHEEAALFGSALAKLWRIPHLYDMHSSLPQQLENFQFTRSRILIRLFNGIEKFILRNSNAVIVICLDLLRTVQKEGFGAKATLLENFIDFPDISKGSPGPAPVREDIASSGTKIVLYTGNFEPYQGMPLLLEAASLLQEINVLFLLVGGNETSLSQMKKKAKELNIENRIRFTGQVLPHLVPGYIALADVLVSPRLSGTNTPLKIYSFLKSGKPLVATNLWTHSQILDESLAILVNPDAPSLSEGIAFALSNPEAQVRAQNARLKAEREYTYPRYLEKMADILVRTKNHFERR